MHTFGPNCVASIRDTFDHILSLANCTPLNALQHVVALNVHLQIVPPSEGPRAHGALELPPSRVLAHVHCQVGLLPEGARADGALEWLLAGVHAHVGHQVAFPVQFAEAYVTRVPLFRLPGTLVLLQEHRANVRTEANGALVLPWRDIEIRSV